MLKAVVGYLLLLICCGVIMSHEIYPRARFIGRIPSWKNSLSVLSYNILLPNSVDGWWTFKNYCPNTPVEHRSWESRCKVLSQSLLSCKPDVVCLQEASERSYETDFRFMKENGYDYEIINKGRMRCITLWNNQRLKILDGGEAISKDRTLTIPFEMISETIQAKSVFWVVNCHLQAGESKADRRLRQVHEGLEVVKKQTNKLKVNFDKVIVCGDFNSDDIEMTNPSAITATSALLQHGIVGKNYTENGRIISKKGKKQTIGKFQDAYEEAYKANNQPPPASLVVPLLIPRLLRNDPRFVVEVEGTGIKNEGKVDEIKTEADVAEEPSNELVPTEGLVECIKQIHGLYCYGEQQETVMSEARVMEWLTDINLSTDRGSEMRSATGILDKKNPSQNSEARCFTAEDLLAVYMAELRGGKFWGVAHDVYTIAKKFGKLEADYIKAVLPEFYRKAAECDADMSDDLFRARFDKIYFSPGLKLEGVMESSSSQAVPNIDEPSDHLPLLASFTI